MAERALEEAGSPPTVGGWLARAGRDLAAGGVASPAFDARLLLEAATGVTPASALARPERVLSPKEAQHLAALLGRRLAREPVSRILGHREFFGRSFQVTPATLDPRPDSETLIAACLEIADGEGWRRRPIRILDVGTGTGCLALTLLAELPLATAVATDVSPAALAVAASNARSLGLADRLELRLADALAGIDGPFELLVSNPPYIASGDIAGLAAEVRLYDPPAALDGGPDGLDVYRSIAAGLIRVVPNGWVVVEVGAGQADAVAVILAAATGSGSPGDGHREPVRRWQDLGGHTRCVAVRTLC